jgi:hypothetical protein
VERFGSTAFGEGQYITIVALNPVADGEVAHALSTPRPESRTGVSPV